MSCVTFALAPLPIVTSAITAPTPITMPSMVKNERSVLRRTSRSAMMSVTESRSAPRRERPSPAADASCGTSLGR